LVFLGGRLDLGKRWGCILFVEIFQRFFVGQFFG